MPIYRRTYRSFEGQVQRRFRWVVIVVQELRVLVKSRALLLLTLVALLHCILRLLQVVAYDVIVQDPNNPLAPALRQVRGLVVDSTMFFDFLRLQSSLVFIICIVAGSGMICNDFRNNLMEIYFSKPISWLDYAMGKIATLLLIGLVLTAAPALVLVVLHNLLAPGLDTLRASYWWPPAIVLFSLVILLPCVLGVLAFSALLRSQNLASISVFMVLAANSAMGVLLAGLLQNRNYLIVSFPMAMNRVGQRLFGDPRLVFTLGWGWALLFVAAVCLWALWIIFRHVRRAEIAA